MILFEQSLRDRGLQSSVIFRRKKKEPVDWFDGLGGNTMRFPPRLNQACVFSSYATIIYTVRPPKIIPIYSLIKLLIIMLSL